MTYKHLSFFFLAFAAILGWNIFLIQRDERLYDAYYRQRAIEILKEKPSSKINYYPREI